MFPNDPNPSRAITFTALYSTLYPPNLAEQHRTKKLLIFCRAKSIHLWLLHYKFMDEIWTHTVTIYNEHNSPVGIRTQMPHTPNVPSCKPRSCYANAKPSMMLSLIHPPYSIMYMYTYILHKLVHCVSTWCCSWSTSKMLSHHIGISLFPSSLLRAREDGAAPWSIAGNPIRNA